jgi:hypothetical protein
MVLFKGTSKIFIPTHHFYGCFVVCGRSPQTTKPEKIKTFYLLTFLQTFFSSFNIPLCYNLSRIP